MCVSIFSTNIYRPKNSCARYEKKNGIGLHVKCRYSCQVQRYLTFLDKFSKKKIKYRISLKSVQWEPSCSVRTDGRTDITKLKVAFRKFANASKNENCLVTASYSHLRQYLFSNCQHLYCTPLANLIRCNFNFFPIYPLPVTSRSAKIHRINSL